MTQLKLLFLSPAVCVCVCSEADRPKIFVHGRAITHAPLNAAIGSSQLGSLHPAAVVLDGNSWVCVAAPWNNTVPLPHSSWELLYQHRLAAGYMVDRPWHGSSTSAAFGLLFELLLAMEESGGLYCSRFLISKQLKSGEIHSTTHCQR